MSGAATGGKRRRSIRRPPREPSLEKRKRSRIVSAVVRRGLTARARTLRQLSYGLLAMIVSVFFVSVGYLIYFQITADQSQIDRMRQQTLDENSRQGDVTKARLAEAQTQLDAQRDKLITPVFALGKVWVRPRDVLLASVQFAADGQHGWAVGDGGTILASDDGGKNWSLQTSGTAYDLISVQFDAGGQRGWAVGVGGTILSSGDGGKNWALQASGTTNDLLSVQFSSDGLHGWAVGDGGTRLRIDPPALTGVRLAQTLEDLRKALKAVGIDERKLGEPFATYIALDSNREAFQKQRDTLDASIAQLKGQLGAKAVAALGQNVVAKELDWDKVFNLVSRFAVVSVVLFLISILVAIYRYTSRLGAHYDAQADALALAEAILPADFHRLVETLAPSRLDFGKMDGAPTEKLLKIATLALQRAR